MRAAVLLLAALLAGCAHYPAVTATADPCVAFRPIYWGAKDTRATLDQIDSHNRVWKELCQKKP
ncbi:MAG: hypothetical protein ACM3IH_03310 [Sphingobacteriales bacterium]